MQDFLLQSSKQISKYMDNFFKKNSLNFEITQLGINALKKIENFSIKGKFLRGTLVLLSYNSLGGRFEKSILPIAGAMELCHSGLLIQDDIMDITKSDEEVGKTTGNDIDKNSFINIIGLERSIEEAETLAKDLENRFKLFNPPLQKALKPIITDYLYRHR